MLQGGVVMRYQGDDEWVLPKVYHNGAWQYCLPYVFSSDIWKLAGAAGVPMVRFVLETDGDLIVYDNHPFLVRKERLVNLSESQILDLIYPVGSIYMSMDSQNPTNKFGGKWEQIQGQFLLGVSSTHAVGSSGGAETASHIHHTFSSTSGSHTLTIAEMPSHGHLVNVWVNAGTTGNAYYYNGATQTTHQGARLYNNSSGQWITAGNTAAAAARGQGDPSGGTGLIGGGGAHTHSIPSLSTDNQTINIMPPYTAVYIWKRTE